MMKRFFTIAILALAVAQGGAFAQEAAADEAQALADKLFTRRYAVIPERQPFGPEPANFDPDTVVSSSAKGGADDAADAAAEEAKQLSEQENKLATAVKVSIINVSLDGSAFVGFTDSTITPPRNYYIKCGDSRDEWRVVAVDEAKREATLEYTGASQKLEMTFKLGGGLGGESAQAASEANAAPGAAAAVRAGLAPSPASARGRLAGRRRTQEEQAEALADMRKQAEEAERRAADERAQMQEQLAALADGLRVAREDAEREREEAERRRKEEAELRERGEEPPPPPPDESDEQEPPL